MPSFRQRRLLLVILAIPVLFLFLLFLNSRRIIADVFSTDAQPSKLPDEIFGLLHFVTSPDESGRVISEPGARGVALDNDSAVQLEDAVAPDKPVAMAWYALGSIAKADEFRAREGSESEPVSGGWEERLEALQEYPLVVFSKSYCPYSRRAKKLLETYDLSPAPKIIEVDWRADSSHIKTLLTRLTHHSTFPNVILRGHSLGGSDDLIRLHEEDRLRQVLEKAGIKVGWTGEGGEGVLL